MKLKFLKSHFFNTGSTPTSMNIGVSPAKAGRGFTLVELLVVFSISSLIGLMVIIGYPDFASNIEFKNQALDVAITIREAQVYGISAKEAGVGLFDTAYGVHFDMNTPGSYIFFADKNLNNLYDIGPDIIIGGSPVVLKSDYTISDLCITKTSGSIDCGIDTLSIFFKRPDPDANIAVGILQNYPSATIDIQNIEGKIKTIRVTNTGQISIQ